jgi:hypothetical protein
VDLVVAFRLTSDKDLRSSILGLLTPVAAMVAGGAAFLNFQETERQNRTVQEQSREQLRLLERGQVTERFTKAGEQLGVTSWTPAWAQSMP